MSETREILRHRLEFLVNTVGGAAEVARAVNVNRTQFLRYLKGDTLPRVDILYAIAQTYDIPIAWFLEASNNPQGLLQEQQIGRRFQRLVSKRRFPISPEAMPDGYYAIWKGLFSQPGQYELLLSTVKIQNGSGAIRSLDPVHRTKFTEQLEVFGICDYRCEGVVFSSGDGICILYSDFYANYVHTAFLTPFAQRWQSPTGLIQMNGVMHALVPARKNATSIVPLFFEQLPNDVGPVLQTARERRAYTKDELPPHVARTFEVMDVPEFAFHGPQAFEDALT